MPNFSTELKYYNFLISTILSNVSEGYPPPEGYIFHPYIPFPINKNGSQSSEPGAFYDKKNE